MTSNGIADRRALADARVRAHRAFDGMWKGMGMYRGDAYRWLAKALGLSSADAHIKNLSVEQCDRLVTAVEKTLARGRRG